MVSNLQKGTKIAKQLQNSTRLKIGGEKNQKTLQENHPKTDWHPKLANLKLQEKKLDGKETEDRKTHHGNKPFQNPSKNTIHQKF